MRWPTVLSLVLVLCLLFPGMPGPGEAPSGREWLITDQQTRSGETIYIEENVTVAAGGRLVLDNVSLLFDHSAPGALSLEVQAAGELVIRNSTLDWNGSEPYMVRALPGSKITISSSTIAHAGTSPNVSMDSGVYVSTDMADIDNTTFQENAAGIWLENCTPTVSHCLFQDNNIGAMLFRSCATLDHCSFESNLGKNAILGGDSHVLALDTLIDPSSISVTTNGSSRMDIGWSVNIGVLWDNGRPADGALVRVKPADAAESLYQTDPTGWARNITAIAMTVDASGTTGHGPFNISAEISGRTVWNITDISAEMDIVLSIDTTPPEVQIDYPPDGAILNVSAMEARGRAWDPNPPHDTPDIESVEASVDAGPWSQAAGREDWSINISGMAEGNHTLVVRARDPAGNVNESSVRFEVDLTVPSLDVWPPFGYLTAATNITVRILSDGDSLYFNGRRLDGNIPGRPFEFNWPLDSEGNNTARVEAWDAAGNFAPRDLLAVRDTVGPSIAILSPPAYATLNSTLAVLTGTCADLHGVAVVEESLDQADWTLCTGNTSWSATVMLAAGVDIVYIRASDILGNANTSWIQLTVRLADTSPPELIVRSPENGDVLASNPVEVLGSAADAGGVALVQVSVDNSTWVNATGTGGWLAELTLASGNNTIFIRAFDLAGNVNRTSLTVRYSPPPLDTTPPSLDIVYPPAGLKFTESMAVVSGKATDNSGIDFVEVSANGGNWSACIVTGEDWSGTVSLSPGDNTISVRAFDGAGNQATRTVNVVFNQPADNRQERETSIVILASAMLAVAAVWLLFRHYKGQEPGGGSGA